MQRIIYALIQGIKYRSCLKNKLSLKRILDLTPQFLIEHHVKILVLDFDGVLASHGEVHMRQDCIDWLNVFLRGWSPESIVVLSNKPRPKRIEAFAQHFPLIDFVQGVAKKPYPQGLLKVCALKKVKPHEILLVDDRLLTGMLACCLSGAQGLLIKKPYKNYFKRPITESFFSFLRVSENLLF